MKIGIYIEYLYTAGGGEKHIGVVAEYLSQNHQVDLITTTDADMEFLQKRLNLDLSKTQVIYWPKMDDQYLDVLTSQYDVFINSTIFSTVRNEAKIGIAMVFFPIVLNFNYPMWFKRLILTTLGLLYSSYDRSFYFEGEHRPDFKQDWEIQEDEISIILNQAAKSVELDFADFSKSLKHNIKKVIVDNVKSEYRIESNKIVIKGPFTVNTNITIQFADYIKPERRVINGHETMPYSLKLTRVKFRYPLKSLRLNFINRLEDFEITNKIHKKLYSMYLKQKSSFRIFNCLRSYNLVWSNSKYTKGWIEKIYGIESKILYPPVEIEHFKPSEKKNIILSAGRFFPPLHGHNKKQYEMIQFFKYAYDTFPEFKKYEYHLCGGLKEDSELDVEYVEKCKKEARGYPIFIHPNYPFEDLKQMYSHSKVFWHASGFGEDKRSPDLFEHFGITTVEAMSAGVVPVVIGEGGQTEIVQEGKNGYLWHTKEEAVEKTLKVITDDKLRDELSKEAIKDSKQYSKDKMVESLKIMLKELNIE